MGVTATYEFDNTRNRVGATGLLRFSAPAVLASTPSVTFHGDVVNIFGRNLEPGVGARYSVTFSGVSAEIVSVAPRVLTVLVPQGAMTGPLVVTPPNLISEPSSLRHPQLSVISPPGVYWFARISFSSPCRSTSAWCFRSLRPLVIGFAWIAAAGEELAKQLQTRAYHRTCLHRQLAAKRASRRLSKCREQRARKCCGKNRQPFHRRNFSR